MDQVELEEEITRTGSEILNLIMDQLIPDMTEEEIAKYNLDYSDEGLSSLGEKISDLLVNLVNKLTPKVESTELEKINLNEYHSDETFNW